MRGLLFIAVLLGSSVVAADQFSISVGSFRDPANARLALERMNLPALEPFSIERAQTSVGEVYRLLSRVYPSRESAEQMLTDTHRLGHDGAWLFKRESTVRVAQEPPLFHDRPVRQSESRLQTAAIKSDSGSTTIPKRVDLTGKEGQLARLADDATQIKSSDVLSITRYEGDSSSIKIDGKLDEALWRELKAYDEFVVLDPDTLVRGPYKTLIRFAYTDDGLYVGADLEQPKETLIKRLSGRDVRELNRDSVNLTLDTSGEGRYGFWFGINLGDSLMDGTALPERQFSNEWDGPWRGASTETENGWSAEFFIPWGTVSMPATGDLRQMGLYMSRKVAHLDERWGWPALPNTKPKFMSALQTIEMRGVAPKQQYSIYPFTGITADEIDDEIRYRVGADFFWRPSTNLQMIATVNPDFGSVESDEAVINLTATETFFPEKRLFFLEGQEIFFASPRADTRSRGVGRGGPPTTMVDTRRIGGKPQSPILTGDQSVSNRELIRPVDLQGAVKMTGQFGSFRYGVMGAFEDEAKFNAVDSVQDINLYQDGSDYGVARLLYETNSGGGYKALGVLSTAVMHYDRDAFVTGLDWHYLTPGGKLKTDGQMFRSDIDGVDVGYGGFWDFEYTFRQGLRQRVGIEHYDEHVDINDLGFQSRNNYTQVRTAHTRTSSNLGWARNNQFDIRGAVQENGDGYFTMGGLFVSNRTTFENLTTFTARLSHFYPAYDDLNSFGNGTYRIEEKTGGSLSFESDTSRAFSYLVGAGYEEEDLGGDSYNYEFKINWRPTDGFSLTLGAKYFDRDGWLLHQEAENFTTFKAEQWLPNFNIEYFISARQQLKLSVQWVAVKAKEDEFYTIPGTPDDLIRSVKPAGPSDSFSISDMVFQFRYRWELAPLSDLFIVYSRTSDLTRALGDSTFEDMFDNAWQEPIGDQLVIKLRYRIGS